MSPSQACRTALFTVALALPAATMAQSPEFKVELDAATCRFSGGTDGLGNVESTARTGGRKIQVRVENGDGFSIDPVQFTGEGAAQMKETAGGSAKVVNIFNENTGPADVKYSIILRNRETGEVRDCDPRIINR